MAIITMTWNNDKDNENDSNHSDSDFVVLLLMILSTICVSNLFAAGGGVASILLYLYACIYYSTSVEVDL